MDADYFRYTRVYAGGVGWESIATPRELAGRDLERLRREARFFPVAALLLGETEPTVEVGEDSGGRSIWRLRYADDPLGPRTLEINQDDHLPISYSYPAPFEEGVLPVRISFADWRPVADILLPFRISSDARDFPISIEVERSN